MPNQLQDGKGLKEAGREMDSINRITINNIILPVRKGFLGDGGASVPGFWERIFSVGGVRLGVRI